MDKQFGKSLILCLIFIISVGFLVACQDNVTSYSLYPAEETFYYGDFYEPLEFPSVKDRDGNLVSNDRLEWSIESGDTAILSQDGQHFELYNKNGKTIFFVVVDNDAKHTLKYTVNVVEGTDGSLNSSLSDANYSVAPGIAKRRVFGNKDIQNGNGAITQAKEIIQLRPGFEDVSVDEYNIRITDENYEDSNRVIEYNLLSSTQLELTYKSAGVANLKVELNRPDEVGIKPFFVYRFNVVDGVNVYDYQDLKGVQDLVTYDQDSNKYTYNRYTGWDGTKFENIVLRNNIQNIDDITLFYGSVYGNGYQLDATPYASDSSKDNHPRIEERTSTHDLDKVSFYLMSDNTFLDNANLMASNQDESNLNLFGDKKGVLGVYGVKDTMTNKDDGDAPYAVDDNIAVVRQAKNIKIINSILEKGRIALSISGAPDQDNPIVVESTVMRYTGDSAIYISSDWGIPRDLWNDNNHYTGEQEFKAFVTIKDIIISAVRTSPIRMQSDYGPNLVSPLLAYPAYGSHLTFLGDHNYIFTWAKLSEVDFGTIGGIDITPIMTQVLDDNQWFVDLVTHWWGNSDDIRENQWFNMLVLNNYTLDISLTEEYNTSPNLIVADNSNLRDVFLPQQSLTVEIMEGLPTARVDLNFARPDILADAPKPQDDLSVLVPQRISEIVPANI